MKKFHRWKIKIFKKKGESMENICRSLDVLLPCQRPIPEKQKLKNKGNYVIGAILVKFRNKDCKTTELGL